MALIRTICKKCFIDSEDFIMELCSTEYSPAPDKYRPGHPPYRPYANQRFDMNASYLCKCRGIRKYTFLLHHKQIELRTLCPDQDFVRFHCSHTNRQAEIERSVPCMQPRTMVYYPLLQKDSL